MSDAYGWILCIVVSVWLLAIGFGAVIDLDKYLQGPREPVTTYHVGFWLSGPIALACGAWCLGASLVWLFRG